MESINKLFRVEPGKLDNTIEMMVEKLNIFESKLNSQKRNKHIFPKTRTVYGVELETDTSPVKSKRRNSSDDYKVGYANKPGLIFMQTIYEDKKEYLGEESGADLQEDIIIGESPEFKTDDVSNLAKTQLDLSDEQ